MEISFLLWDLQKHDITGVSVSTLLPAQILRSCKVEVRLSTDSMETLSQEELFSAIQDLLLVESLSAEPTDE